MTQLFISLTAPPSANRIWRVSRGTVHKSEKYKQWLQSQQWSIIQQLGDERPSEPLQGPISVTVWVHPRDNRLRDLDNYCKPILDLIESAALIQDDRQVSRILLFRDIPKGEHTVDVTVTQI